MSAAAVRLYRLVLLLDPAEFRRHYRDDMVQLLVDRQLHEARRTPLVVLTEAFDAVRTAPRMRWEYEVMELPADPGLSIVAFSAEPGSPSDEALRLLGSWAATHDPSVPSP